jgi:hypothetical protein
MKKHSIHYLILLILLMSCGQNKSSKQALTIDSTKISAAYLDTGKIAILPIDTSYSFLFKDAAETNLTNTEIDETDRILNQCINENNKNPDKNSGEHINLSEYKRQYIPFKNKKGEKLVWVNCFCNDEIPDFDYWKKQIVFVKDGGSCFFNVTINLTTQSFDQLEVNGHA